MSAKQHIQDLENLANELRFALDSSNAHIEKLEECNKEDGQSAILQEIAEKERDAAQKLLREYAREVAIARAAVVMIERVNKELREENAQLRQMFDSSDVEGRNMLTVNILRQLTREHQIALCKHVLGDELEQSQAGKPT
ncbi:MAG: hypothetical protein JWQ03_3217 [Variovorax sp.]|nr:hypothetical protein [Variovorax sp.]